MDIKTLLLLFFFGMVCNLQCQSYDNLIYLSTAPGWASENGGITGGDKAQPVSVKTIEEFQRLVSLEEPKTILLSGSIGEGLPTKIRVNSNKTIIGLNKALLKGSLYLRDAKNIIVRNLTIEGPGAIDVNGPDCITIDNSTNVWLDHLDIYDGQDGNLDIVNGSNYITVSWCKFHYTSASTNHKLSTLIGNSDEKTSDRGKLKVTMVYNWWAEGVESRMPRVRFGQVHVVNNLYTSAGNDYCILAGIEADLRIEYNLFINVREPVNISQKTFFAVSTSNNKFVSVKGNTEGKGTAFNPPYKINIIPTEKMEKIIKQHAGATITDIKKFNIL